MTKRRRANPVAIVRRGGAIGLLAVSLAACPGDGDTPTRPNEFYTVQMVNDDSEPVHMLAPGEDFPTGRLEAGTARSTTVEFRGIAVTFRAGRNGEILAALVCEPVTNNEETGVVVWTGQALTCAGALAAL